MNIFFGKISKLFDPNQIVKGYYIAPKGSSWFGDLNLEDYVYLIGGDKIQFWQAKKWGEKDGKECLFFEILNPDLGIKISQLSMLKFLKMTKALVVLTSRSANNRAFFRLELIKEVTPEYLADSNTYLDNQIFRKIRVEKNVDVIQDTEDIIVYYENENLKLYPSKFIEQSILESFRDNTKYIGLGSVMKDNVISYFNKKTKILPALLDQSKISLRSFYDTFFCEYKEKTKYFVVGAFWDTSDPQDQTERFLKEGIWFNGYEDKFNNEVNAVPVGSSIAIKSTFVREKTKSVMRIKARGVVTDNLQDGQTLKIDWEDDFTPFEVDFGGYRKTIKEVSKADHIKSIWSPEINNLESTPEINNSQKSNGNMNNFPLNQILYGPPGTGKTYKLLNEYFNYFRITDKTINKEEYETEIISKLNWWQIITLVLLEGKAKVPDIKKHRYIKYKLQVSNTKSLNQTVWGQLSSHTIQESETVNYARRVDPLFFDKSADSTWHIIEEKKDLIDDLTEIAFKINDYKENKVTANNYKFITFHQSFSYEDFIEGIKPVMNEESSEENINYSIEKGIFYNCCDEAAKLAGFLSLKDAIENYSKSERVERFKSAKPYGIFIDEINRGNISQIFGELITLIEEDKRLGESEIILELPYSKNKFGVPPNLFIIGTMNTADRSVEALDAALRRRFCFEEMPPLYELEGLQKDIFGYKASGILKTINSRIEKLIDKDHTIGHSYLLNKDKDSIVDSFYKNIIPLLQEYFFGDYGKLGLVLGKGFVHLKESDKGTDTFAYFDDAPDDFENRNVYEIIDYRKVKDYTLLLNKVDVIMDFEKAIQVLMNKKFV